MIFAVLDPSPLTVCINCSFFTFIGSICDYDLFGVMSRRQTGNKKFFWRWRRVGRDRAEVTLCGRSFQMVGPETSKAGPPTVDSLTDETCRRLVCSERRERPPGRSATRISWFRHVGTDPCRALYMSTATLNCTQSGERSQWKLISSS